MCVCVCVRTRAHKCWFDAVIDFEGDRSLKALTKFIKEHAVIPYELKKKADVESADAESDASEAPEPSDAKDEL